MSWERKTNYQGVEYGPYYAVDKKGTIFGSVQQCVGDKAHLWHTWVLPRGNIEPKQSAYAGSKERAMYFVECWAKHHFKWTL